MIQFREGFYADIRTEDRSRTSIAYQGGILEDGKLVGRLPELNIGGNFYDLLGKDYLGAVNGDLVKEDGLLCAVRMDVEQA